MLARTLFCELRSISFRPTPARLKREAERTLDKIVTLMVRIGHDVRKQWDGLLLALQFGVEAPEW